MARETLAAHAILVHFNNLENLTEANAERAAALLRDIRDLCFMVDGFHWLIVGTEDAVRTVIDAQPQLATIFSTPPALAPLSQEEVLELQAFRRGFTRDLHGARRGNWRTSGRWLRRSGGCALPGGYGTVPRALVLAESG